MDEELILRVSLTTVRDIHAVAVLREGQVVGHIPYNLQLALTVKLFLRREVNKRFVEVNGARVNGLAMA